MKKVIVLLLVGLLSMVFVACGNNSNDVESKNNNKSNGNKKGKLVIKYSHPNAPDSVAGKQADLFAEIVNEKTNGEIEIEVYPSGQLGNLQEITESVELGTIGMSHNTMAANASLLEDLEAFDTPYIFESPEQMDKVMAPDSSVMSMLNDKLIDESGVRMLYSFYFGTRHLTANKAVNSPDDLKGVKIRSIPYDIYTATVEGMGADAVPVDWNEVPTSLQTGVIDGQENPLDVVVANSLYELQDYLMMTGHIIASSGVVINEKVWQGLSESQQDAMLEAAKEARAKSMEWNLEVEESALDEIKDKGMNVISVDELQLNKFESAIKEIIENRFSEKFSDVYEEIEKAK